MLPPISGGAARLLAVHMLAHMVLIAVAAPLLAYGVSGMLDRRPRRLARVLAHPLIGLVAFNGTLLLWQAPGMVAAMMEHAAVHQLAHLSLLGSAVCLWYPVVRPLGAPGSITRIARIGYLLLAGVPPTVPGMILVLARRPLYAIYPELEDQQLAGIVLFGTAKLALVAGTLVAIWQLLTPEAEPPDDRGDGGTGPTEPPVAPAWLARLDDVLPAEPAPAIRSGARDRPSATVVADSDRVLPGRAPGAGAPGSPPPGAAVPAIGETARRSIGIEPAGQRPSAAALARPHRRSPR